MRIGLAGPKTEQPCYFTRPTIELQDESANFAAVVFVIHHKQPQTDQFGDDPVCANVHWAFGLMDCGVHITELVAGTIGMVAVVQRDRSGTVE